MNYAKEVRKVLWITLMLNLLGAGVKIIYGYNTGTNSMQADGFHSFFDGTSNVIGLIGIWLAVKPPDMRHHYGHKKFETMATIGITTLLFLSSVEILESAVRSFLNPSPPEVTDTGFFIVIATMGLNIFTAMYEYRSGRALKSDFLIADAKHTASDLLASFMVFISMVSAKNGYPVVDPVAAILIAILIGRIGYNIIKGASEVLVDASPLIYEDLTKIKDIAATVRGVRECHNIRVRGRNDAIHIDCHLLVSPEMNIQNAHEVADKVEEKIKAEIPGVVDIVVHLEPFEK
ncbi:MAG: cation transporter [Nitrospinae bacterium]|nr:cation transporter [Nitrospinota bacterium]